jgi:type VI secretion system secreted protein Hcp
MSIFVKYGTIKGDATHQEHKEWIAVDSLQWGVGRSISTSPGNTQDREASEPSISEVTVTKAMDGSSIYLFKEACTGNKGQDCLVHVVQTGAPGRTVLEYKLSDTLVSSYSASSGGDAPTESVSFNFTKIEYKYITYDAAGSPKPATAFYDMATTKSG